MGATARLICAVVSVVLGIVNLPYEWLTDNATRRVERIRSGFSLHPPRVVLTHSLGAPDGGRASVRTGPSPLVGAPSILLGVFGLESIPPTAPCCQRLPWVFALSAPNPSRESTAARQGVRHGEHQALSGDSGTRALRAGADGARRGIAPRIRDCVRTR